MLLFLFWFYIILGCIEIYTHTNYYKSCFKSFSTSSQQSSCRSNIIYSNVCAMQLKPLGSTGYYLFRVSRCMSFASYEHHECLLVDATSLDSEIGSITSETGLSEWLSASAMDGSHGTGIPPVHHQSTTSMFSWPASWALFIFFGNNLGTSGSSSSSVCLRWHSAAWLWLYMNLLISLVYLK